MRQRQANNTVRITRDILILALYGATATLFKALGLPQIAADGFSPWYFLSALNLALLIAGGLQHTPLVFLTTLIVDVWFDLSLSPAFWPGVVGAAIETGILALAARAFATPETQRFPLRQVRAVGRFTLMIALTAIALAAALATRLAITQGLSNPSYPTLLLNTGVSYAVSMATLTPFLIACGIPWMAVLAEHVASRATQKQTLHHPKLAIIEIVEILLEAAGASLLVWVAFNPRFSEQLHLAYICFLPLLWIALRHGLPRVSLGILMIAISAIGIIQHHGYTADGILGLQVFLLILSLSGLFVGAVVAERRKAQEMLRESRTMAYAILNATTESAFLIDSDGVVLTCNEALAQKFRSQVQTIVGTNIYEWLPDYVTDSRRAAVEQVMTSGQPLRFEDHRAGKVLDNSLYPVFDTEGRVDKIAIFASDITQRRQAEETLRRRTKELAFLNVASQTLSASLDLKQVLTVTLEETSKLLDIAACSLWLFDDERTGLICQQATGSQKDVVCNWQMAPGEGLVGWVTEQGESLIIDDAQADPRHFKGVDERTGLILRAILTVPLKSQRGVIGVLQAVDTAPNRFDATHLEILEPLAASAAIAIENARLYEQAQQEIRERQQMEQALRESEARFRLVANTAPVMIWMANPDGLCTYFNRPWLEFRGRTLEQEWGDGWTSGVHPADVDMCLATYCAALQSHESFSMEYRLQNATGDYRWILDQGAPRFHPDGSLAGFIGACIDITTLKETEQALQESETRFRSIVDALPQMVAYTDKDLVYRFVNRAYKRVFDIAPEEILGKTLPAVIGETAFAQARPHVERALRGEYVRYYEHYKYGPGHQRHIDGQLIPDVDRKGHVRGYYAVLTDISPYKAFEAALRESEARYRAVVEDQTELVCRVSSQTVEGVILRLTFVNQAFCHFFGKLRETLLGRTFLDLAPDADRDLARQRFQSLSRLSPVATCEHRAIAANGELRWIQWTDRAIFDEAGRLVEIQSVGRDVTERRRIAQLFEKTFKAIPDPAILWRHREDATLPQEAFLLELYNPAADQMSRGTIARFVGATAASFFEHSPDTVARIYATFTTGETQRVETEFRLRTTGEYKWLSADYVKVSDNYVLNIISDITERKRMEQLLRESETLHRVTMENIPDPLFITDKEGNFTYICANVSSCLGYTVAEIETLGNISELTGAPLFDFAELEAKGEILNIELPVANQAGEIRDFLITAKRVHIREGAVLYTWRDITARKQAEAALERAQRDRDLILDTTTEIFAYFNTDLEIQWANRAAGAFTGRDPKALIGLRCYEAWHQYATPCEQCPVLAALHTGEAQEAEITTPDGKIWQMRGYPIYEQGRITGLVESGRDITERKRAELALRESNEQLRTLFEDTMNPILLVDEEHHYIDANEAALRFLECTLEELREKTIWDFATPDQGAYFRETTVPFFARRSEEVDHIVNGRVKTLLLNMIPVTISDQKFLYGIGQDITQLKTTTTELEHEVRRTGALVRTAARLNRYLSRDALLQAACEESARALGTSGAAILIYQPADERFTLARHTGLSELYDTHYQPPTRLEYDRTMGEDGYVIIPDARIADEINRRLHVQHDICTVVGVKLHYGDELLGILTVHTRETSRKFTEDELTLLRGIADQVTQALINVRLFEQVRAGQQRLKQLSRRLVEAQETERRHIARELHDEIGQALTVLKINLQASKRAADGAKLQELLEASLDIVEATLQQVRDLSLNLRPSLLDDLGLAPALRWFLDRQSQQTGFDTHFSAGDIPAALPPDLEIAYFRIAQEALTNIIRHAKAQHVSVELRMSAGELHLTIQDDGVGFDVPQALRETAHGISLGLANMQERAQLAGGRITITSAPDKGTRIHVCTPVGARTGVPAPENEDS